MNINFFLDFLYEGEQNGKKGRGMMMEEYVLELYNLLYTTEWQDIVSFLGIVFCMKIVIVYMEEQGMFYSFSSPFDVATRAVAELCQGELRTNSFCSILYDSIYNSNCKEERK